MAHFAEIDKENKVLRVVVVSNSDTTDIYGNENEKIGIGFLKKLYGVHTNWLKTSYNTRSGKHTGGKFPFRGNYASTEMIYEPTIDAFIAPRPTDSYGVLCESWTCDAETDYQWEPPIQKPTTFPDGLIGEYIWNEQAHQENNSNGWDFVGTSAPNPES